MDDYSTVLKLSEARAMLDNGGLRHCNFSENEETDLDNLYKFEVKTKEKRSVQHARFSDNNPT